MFNTSHVNLWIKHVQLFISFSVNAFFLRFLQFFKCPNSIRNSDKTSVCPSNRIQSGNVFFSIQASNIKNTDNVTLIDRTVLSLIYPAMNSSFLSSVMAVFDKGQPLVYTFIPSFIPNMILLKGFYIHVSL